MSCLHVEGTQVYRYYISYITSINLSTAVRESTVNVKVNIHEHTGQLYTWVVKMVVGTQNRYSL